MDVKYINPFIQSTTQVFKTMVFSEVLLCKPYLKQKDKPVSDISGSIGVTGKVNGVVSICFDKETACLVVSKFLNEKITTFSPLVSDAIGEIANMITGVAKKYFQEMNLDCKIALPSVVIGSGHTVAFPSTVPVMIIPFQLKENNKTFYVEVCLNIG